jgi:putative ribosome biogenesis GTPase RsgA
MEGIIIKNQSNDYTVRTKNGIYVCKPRGKFRQVGITPLVGDIAVIDDIPTDTSDLTNGAGYITGITKSMVTTALGYTPYNSTNPNGYITDITK